MRASEPTTTRLHVFTGKGGVGKSTCAAAAGLAAAEAGERVLLVSTDPAHSLGDALARPLGPAPERVWAAPEGLGALDALEQDAGAALTAWVRARRPALADLLRKGTSLDDEDAARVLDLALPGVDELMGLLEVERLSRTGDHDLIVLDTAPTGHALRLLAAPAGLQDLARVLDGLQAKHRVLRARFAGPAPAADDPGQALVDELRADVARLLARRGDPRRTRISWVLNAERLALEETLDGVARLLELGAPAPELVVNRRTPTPKGACGSCAARALAERDVLVELGQRLPGLAQRRIPAFARAPRGLAALRPVARALAQVAPPRDATPSPNPALPSPPRPTRRGPPEAGAARGDVPSSAAAALAPPGTRLLLFGGKGGVGKTTCAAATGLALAAARPAARVLVVSLDPAHSLGDALGEALGDEPRSILRASEPTTARGEGTQVGGGCLDARELDGQRTFDALREHHRAAVDRALTGLLGGLGGAAELDRAVTRDLLELTPAGVDELAGVLALSELVQASDRGEAGAYDVVVVDAPPTGHALSLLEAPALALAWTRTWLDLLLKYRAVIPLSDLAQDVLALARALRRLDAVLRDPQATRFVPVLRADELSRLETERLLDRLRELDVAAPVALVNARSPSPAKKGACARCARQRDAEERVLAAFRRHPAAPPRLLQAPARYPPPRGVEELRGWAGDWSESP